MPKVRFSFELSEKDAKALRRLVHFERHCEEIGIHGWVAQEGPKGRTVVQIRKQVAFLKRLQAKLKGPVRREAKG